MEKNNKSEYIELGGIIEKIGKNKKLFYKTIPIAMILSYLYIICVPRYYTAETTVVPELGNASMDGTIGNIASMFGVDLGSQSLDAISPLLYPNLLEDDGFISELFPVKVTFNDKDDHPMTTTYYDYIAKHQKYAWWTVAISFVTNLISSDKKDGTLNATAVPYYFDKRQNDIAGALRSNISINVDKRTSIITITVKDQDAKICKNMADTVRVNLLNFITRYRTKKATIDLEHYKSLMIQAKMEYNDAVKRYSGIVDSNQNVVLQSVHSKQDVAENEMQMKYDSYMALEKQYEMAKVKVQERTPAFTMLKGASVPIKPAGPKRMFFVIFICIMTTLVDIAYIFRSDIKTSIKSAKI